MRICYTKEEGAKIEKDLNNIDWGSCAAHSRCDIAPGWGIWLIYADSHGLYEGCPGIVKNIVTGELYIALITDVFIELRDEITPAQANKILEAAQLINVGLWGDKNDTTTQNV